MPNDAKICSQQSADDRAPNLVVNTIHHFVILSSLAIS